MVFFAKIEFIIIPTNTNQNRKNVIQQRYIN